MPCWIEICRDYYFARPEETKVGSSHSSGEDKIREEVGVELRDHLGKDRIGDRETRLGGTKADTATDAFTDATENITTRKTFAMA